MKKSPEVLVVFFALFLLLPLSFVFAQSTISTGSIQGTVTDPRDAVIPNANITITNTGTGQSVKTTSSSSGGFSSGPLLPGKYQVRIEASGFQTTVVTTTVQVGVVSSANAKLTIGSASDVIDVASNAVEINTEQATVQGVLTAEQIDTLPINGRNFLDLAQLEPGVQIQDGATFDPTKNGYSSISFGGRYGRTARIEVDGIDISDENVGTTTQNVPAGAIQEFQISQSSLDMSTELTSSGSVNLVTRSGTNNWHGQGFGLFRDHTLAAEITDHDVYFQRSQFGGRLGGPIIKDKLFFFADAERVKQDVLDQVATGAPFSTLAGGFSSPFRDTDGLAKLDWQIKPDNYHVFYRFSYEQNRAVRAFDPQAFQPFANVDHTPSDAVGLDFTTGGFTHQVRFGYMKFRNGITDAVAGSNIFDPAPGIELAIGGDPFCVGNAFDPICTGPNLLAPQETIQQNYQTKYDGSKSVGSHIVRYGFTWNHIHVGGLAAFLALGPAVSSAANGVTISNLFPGGASNPLNYPANTVIFGNGQGFSSEKPAFGLPGGGQGPDERIEWYIGDSWKVLHNLTLTYGLRYVHDTGRTDSDLGPLPVLNTLVPGLGNGVSNPGSNFAPQVGFAWSPWNDRKTVVRGGVGLFYENSIFNNNLFDRPGRLQQGLFLAFNGACSGGTANPYTLPGTATTITPTYCGQPIGSVYQSIIAAQQQYDAATAASGAAANPAYIGSSFSASTANSVTPFAPNYQTPRSWQANIGFQRELGKGIVLTADYLRNVETHSLIGVDVNHVGAARYFNVANATAAISATNAHFGCGASATAAATDCAITAGALIGDYAGNGLDSGTNLCGGNPCPNAAFPGMNPAFGTMQMLFPGGRSTYNGLQLSLKANIHDPIKGLKALSWQVSYAYSHADGLVKDGDFITEATDNDNPTKFFGPNSLDRRHQLSFGGTFEFPYAIRFSAISHFYSPLPLTLTVPGGGTGGIFISDLTGDGSGDGSGVYPTGDVLPGTNVGSFGRGVSASGLGSVITNYNSTQAGQVTPAGQALIQSGLMTQAQLAALGGVQQPIALPPTGQVGLDWLRALDFKLGWHKTIRENMAIEPSVSFFNVMNFANFDAPGNTISGILDGSIGSANGTTMAQRNSGQSSNRIAAGSGTFGFGSPRVIEFGLTFDF